MNKTNIKYLMELAKTSEKASYALEAINNNTAVLMDSKCPLCNSLLTEELTGYHTISCVNDECKYYECDIWSYKNDIAQ